MNKPSVPQERPAFTIKKEATVLSAPTGQLNTANTSVIQLIAEQQQKSSSSVQDGPAKPFDSDDLNIRWRTLAHEFKASGEEQLYHLMIKRDPQHVLDEAYRFSVENEYSRTRLEKSLPDIVEKLRRELQNNLLTIEIHFEGAAEDQNTKFLNGHDKFEKLSKKNPSLRLFKDLFNLDIEY